VEVTTPITGFEWEPACARRNCGCPLSQHKGNLYAGEGCSVCGACLGFLADSDCPECDGTGLEERPNRTTGVMMTYPCGDCDGSGIADWAREDEAG
jgi:DnaJ-class molecular chaperone